MVISKFKQLNVPDMNIKFKNSFPVYIICLVFSSVLIYNTKAQNTLDIHTWEMHEIELKAEKEYKNYYAEVTCWTT